MNKPVKLVISRRMMFANVGHRPVTQQRIRLSALPEGKLTSLQQDYINHTSILDDYKEDCGEATAHMYSTPNLRITSSLARRNVGTPTAMRGPGAVPGLFALESAMDELAIKLHMDPVQLRLLNEPKIDEGLNVPFSSRHLKECFNTGMDTFGWSKRTPMVGSMKRGGLTLGWGMAAATWQAQRFPCHAAVELRDDGTARVACGTQDIGTGTYTILAQVAAEKLGITVEKVHVDLGDTNLPAGPISGGSMVTASVIPAVCEAVAKAVETLINTAAKVKYTSHKPDGLAFTNGHVHVKGEPAQKGMWFADVLKHAKQKLITGRGFSASTMGKEKPKVSSNSYGAHFVEVTWQPEIARLRVSRVLTVIDAGRILNPLPGRNQIEGAVVMGIGMALLEETQYDQRQGASMNANLADDLVATHADVPKLEVHFLDYPDTHLNEFGARGIGEIGLAGTAAAIANAVYHATGVRVRKLPIKIEHLLGK
ncbi:MAG: xanthine dehydrogenase family protein molybdopterin-binding subunit [Gemmatales bacterium]